jgi:RES domain-containing protein
MPLAGGRYVGPLYRALNPVYARVPLSGEGAARYGGRFNPIGLETLYTALSPATALAEANQVGSLQPTILVSYDADVGPVFDTRDREALAGQGSDVARLADPGWRAAMLAGAPVPTQDLAKALVRQGYAGMLVRSFAKGAPVDGLNLVLWRWSGETCDLSVVDDEDRLGRM